MKQKESTQGEKKKMNIGKIVLRTQERKKKEEKSVTEQETKTKQGRARETERERKERKKETENVKKKGRQHTGTSRGEKVGKERGRLTD